MNSDKLENFGYPYSPSLINTAVGSKALKKRVYIFNFCPTRSRTHSLIFDQFDSNKIKNIFFLKIDF